MKDRSLVTCPYCHSSDLSICDLSFWEDGEATLGAGIEGECPHLVAIWWNFQDFSPEADAGCGDSQMWGWIHLEVCELTCEQLSLDRDHLDEEVDSLISTIGELPPVDLPPFEIINRTIELAEGSPEPDDADDEQVLDHISIAALFSIEPVELIHLAIPMLLDKKKQEEQAARDKELADIEKWTQYANNLVIGDKIHQEACRHTVESILESRGLVLENVKKWGPTALPNNNAITQACQRIRSKRSSCSDRIAAANQLRENLGNNVNQLFVDWIDRRVACWRDRG